MEIVKNALAPVVSGYSLGPITIKSTNRNVLTPNLAVQLRDDETERLDFLIVIAFI